MLRTIALALAAASLTVTLHAQRTVLEPLDAHSRITYFITQGSKDSGWRPSDAELAVWALKAWERTAAGKLSFGPGAESTATIQVHWVGSNGGQYGEMRPLLVDGHRGAAVFITPETDGLGDDIAAQAHRDPLFRETIVYLTCLHELGHALGLPHTSDYRDIMYFFGYGGDIVNYFARYRNQLKSRDDIARVSGLSEDDVRRVNGLYSVR